MEKDNFNVIRAYESHVGLEEYLKVKCWEMIEGLIQKYIVRKEDFCW